MPRWQLQSKLRLRRSIWRRMAISCSLCLCRHTSLQLLPHHPIITIYLHWLSRITAVLLYTYYFHVTNGERDGRTPKPWLTVPPAAGLPGTCVSQPWIPTDGQCHWKRGGVQQTLEWRKYYDNNSSSRYKIALSWRALTVVRAHEKWALVQIFPTKSSTFHWCQSPRFNSFFIF